MRRPPHTTRSTGSILAALLLAFGPLAGLLLAAGHDRGDLDQVRRRYGMALVRAVQQKHWPASLEGLVARLEQAERDENWSDYYESAGRLFTALEGEEWRGGREQAFSLRVTLDHALVDPEGPIIVRLAQAFEPGCPLPRDWSVEVTLWRRALLGRGACLRRLGRIDRLDGELAVEPASPWQPGAYEIVGRLLVGHEVAHELRSSAPFSVAPSFQDRCREVSSQRRRIEETLDEQRKGLLSDALLVARYPEDLADQMNRGLLTIQEIAVPRELGWAEQTLREIKEGGLPLADLRGDSRRVHRYEAREALYPYRLFVPASFDSRHAQPLVVALHGLGGDEMSWDLYGRGMLLREAARRGLIVACPLGIDRASFYLGHGRDEVFDLIDDLRSRLPIDPRRIYLIGHSMGGFGTFGLAMARPDLFAAIAPISGGGDPRRASEIASVPQYVVHGDADQVVPLRLSRLMVEASRRAGADVTFRVIKGAGHIGVVARTLPDILDWLVSKHR